MVLQLRRSSRLLALNKKNDHVIKSLSTTVKCNTLKKVAVSKKIKQKSKNLVKKSKKNDDDDEESTIWKHGTLSRDYEMKIYEKFPNVTTVAGADEAGRGPLAGPVVAAACFVPLEGVDIEGIQDSKKLSEKERELLYEQITQHPQIKYAVHVADHLRIDEINILQASLESMAKAIEKLPVKADYALIDGNKLPTLAIRGESVVKGDSKVFSIAAASIIAKVTRDRIMVECDEKWPNYGFAKHKGYPTKAHMHAISVNGPCPIHRMTFAPLKYMK